MVRNELFFLCRDSRCDCTHMDFHFFVCTLFVIQIASSQWLLVYKKELVVIVKTGFTMWIVHTCLEFINTEYFGSDPYLTIFKLFLETSGWVLQFSRNQYLLFWLIVFRIYKMTIRKSKSQHFCAFVYNRHQCPSVVIILYKKITFARTIINEKWIKKFWLSKSFRTRYKTRTLVGIENWIWPFSWISWLVIDTLFQCSPFLVFIRKRICNRKFDILLQITTFSTRKLERWIAQKKTNSLCCGWKSSCCWL